MRPLVIATLALGLTGCSSTQITGSWSLPNSPAQRFGRILVVAATPNPEARQIFEDAMADALKRKGHNVALGRKILPEDAAEQDRSALRQFVIDQGIDAVVLMALIEATTSYSYVPPTDTRPADISYALGPYYSYYRGLRPPAPPDPKLPDAPEYQARQTVRLEGNLYDLSLPEGEGLIWNAQTQTLNPTDMQKLADDYVKALVTSLYLRNVLE